MLLNHLHHVAIICADYAAAKHFYADILGLKIIRETYRAERNSYKLDLAVGDTYQIELFSFPNPPARVNQPEARGLRHLAFAVTDLNVCISYLQTHYVPCEPIRTDELTGKRFTFFSDPDGLPLELYEQ